ncbi:BCCT family transporter [Mycolicibacterium smegmatis]|uniref:BCCT family transporter n=1 Tax=Mycolicibacterium smegmatis TaxID=1772 RepID=UPI0033903986
MTGSFGWLYLVITLGILVFLVFLAFSPYGNTRLGKDTDPAVTIKSLESVLS